MSALSSHPTSARRRSSCCRRCRPSTGKIAEHKLAESLRSLSECGGVRRRVLASGRTQLKKRNATVAVVGAGDFIGGEIAKKFAAEGFTVFVGRRQSEKLEPLIKEIEAAGAPYLGVLSMRARKRRW